MAILTEKRLRQIIREEFKQQKMFPNWEGEQEVTATLDVLDYADWKAQAKKYDVKCKLLNPRGPGGGCPVVSCTGTDANLRKLLTQSQYCDADECDFYIYGD